MVGNRSETLAGWCAYQRRRNLSEGTIDARRRLLTRWWDHADDVWTSDHHAVEGWLDELELTAASRYGAISHLHCFYGWALRDGRTDSDPTVMIDRPRLRQRLPRPIHPTDLDLAVLAAGGSMRVGLLLAATSGLRCCELARLRWDDVHDGRARVLGKGDLERVVPIHRLAVEELDGLGRSSVFVLDGWQTPSLASPGRRASQRINDHLRSLGITATAHQLRHFAATAALRSARGDLRKVQQLLGHATPATTALYTALDVDDLVDVVQGIAIGDW